MTQITDRQKDSEIIARLIYMAFVAPERANINIGDVSFVPFAAALELYARAAARETVSESDAPLEPEESEALKMAAVGEAAAQGLYDGIRAGLQTAADTHTHTQPGPMTAEAESRTPSPEKEHRKSARSSNTCSASSTPTAARAAGSPRKPTAH